MFIDYSCLPLMVHTYFTSTLFAPVPHYLIDVDGEPMIDGIRPLPSNEHAKFYQFYLRRIGRVDAYRELSFLEYARRFRYDFAKDTVFPRRVTRGLHAHKEGCAIGIQYCWELMDLFVGQFVAMNIAHDATHRNQLCSPMDSVPENTRYFQPQLKAGLHTVLSIFKWFAISGMSYPHWRTLHPVRCALPSATISHLL